MTTDQIVHFVDARPLDPFTMFLCDGRELHILHPELVSLGFGAMSVTVIHPNGQVEVVDTALIVSVRTIYSADMFTV